MNNRRRLAQGVIVFIFMFSVFLVNRNDFSNIIVGLIMVTGASLILIIFELYDKYRQ